MQTLFVYITLVASQCKTNMYKVKKIYRQITIQKCFLRAVFREVLIDSLHRRFLGLIDSNMYGWMTFKTGLSLSQSFCLPSAISLQVTPSSKGSVGICSSFAFKVVYTKTVYFKTGPKNDIFKWLY